MKKIVSRLATLRSNAAEPTAADRRFRVNLLLAVTIAMAILECV